MTPAELDSSALKSSVAFTGRLACMTRAEAFEVVRQYGRNAQPNGHEAHEITHRRRTWLAFAG